MKLPEIDIDQYKLSMGISASEFALKKANEFRSSFFSNSQSGGSQSNPDAGKYASSDGGDMNDPDWVDLKDDPVTTSNEGLNK